MTIMRYEVCRCYLEMVFLQPPQKLPMSMSGVIDISDGDVESLVSFSSS